MEEQTGSLKKCLIKRKSTSLNAENIVRFKICGELYKFKRMTFGMSSSTVHIIKSHTATFKYYYV